MAKPLRTYQPSKIKRARTHGFLERMSTPGGKKSIKRRRALIPGRLRAELPWQTKTSRRGWRTGWRALT